MQDKPWYRKYPEITQQIADNRELLCERCRQLGTSLAMVQGQFSREIIARIVHESNWQEGIFLEKGRTRELADAVFDELESAGDPNISFDGLVASHRAAVVRLVQSGASEEELAALNLSRAHIALSWISEEFNSRQTAALMQVFKSLTQRIEDDHVDVSKDMEDVIKKGSDALGRLAAHKSANVLPLSIECPTFGEHLSLLVQSDFDELVKPMRIEHIHFLHRITMMGVLPPDECGVFRSRPVHVGNPDLYFPPPAALAGMMKEFCMEFPVPSVGVKNQFDVIMKAAEFSYRFVRIHPYVDGNGRLSRLIMNLILRS